MAFIKWPSKRAARKHGIGAYKKRAHLNISIENLSNDIVELKTKETSWLCRNLKDYSANTSLHGIKFIGESERSPLERIWWSVIVILSFCCCSYLISKIWIKWNTSPVIVSYEENATPVWEIPFPAVTICPTTKSDILLFNFSRACDESVDLTEEETAIYGVASMFCFERCSRNASKFISASDFYNYYRTTLQREEIMNECFGLGTDEDDCKSLTSEIFTEEGICFTLNMLSPKDIFSTAGIESAVFMQSNKTSVGWNIDAGYLPDAPFYTYPFRANPNGMLKSFSINLVHHKQNTDLKCSPAFSGFKVILHQPHIIPNTMTGFFWAQMNSDLSVSLSPKMITTSPELRSYSPELRQCYFADERKLKFFKEYSRELCELECLTNLTLQVCKCVTPMMPRNYWMRVCGLGMLPCTDYVKDEFTKMGLRFNSEDVNKRQRSAFERATKCDCLPSCTSIIYETSISQAKLDRNVYTKENNITDGYADTAMSNLIIYFKESYFIKLKRSELYGLVDFLSSCGGLLGVFLGFSILSLMEIIYFFILRSLI